ncbi:unnamed protein product, partial [Brassica rapa]
RYENKRETSLKRRDTIKLDLEVEYIGHHQLFVSVFFLIFHLIISFYWHASSKVAGLSISFNIMLIKDVIVNVGSYVKL